MSQRAHYVIVEGGTWHLFRSNWGATTIELDILGGPRIAARFVRSQREVGPHDWLNDTWCEAAVLIDHDTHALLLFNTHSRDYDQRAAALEVLRETWPGWAVHWAYDGLGDLVAHVGLSRSLVRDDNSPDPPRAAEDSNWVETMVTVANGDRVRAYAIVDFSVPEVVDYGHGFLALLPDEAGVTKLVTIPESGVHLDVPARAAGMWTTTGTLDGAWERAAALWPGWRWEFWDDDYGEQVRRANGAVRLPTPCPAAGIAALGERVRGHPHERDPGARALQLVDRLSAQGKRATPSPYLGDHTSLALTAAEQEAVESAVRTVAARYGVESR